MLNNEDNNSGAANNNVTSTTTDAIADNETTNALPKKSFSISAEDATAKAFENMKKRVLAATGNKRNLETLGWRAEINVRKKGSSAGTRDITYVEPLKMKRYRTMNDILVALGVTVDETVSREELYAEIKEEFNPKLVKYRLPMVLKHLPKMFNKKLVIIELGTMVVEKLLPNEQPKYHTPVTIFPVGYKSSCFFDNYENHESDEPIQYFNEILKSNDNTGPIF
eukprot:g3612.t1